MKLNLAFSSILAPSLLLFSVYGAPNDPSGGQCDVLERGERLFPLCIQVYSALNAATLLREMGASGAAVGAAMDRLADAEAAYAAENLVGDEIVPGLLGPGPGCPARITDAIADCGFSIVSTDVSGRDDPPTDKGHSWNFEISTRVDAHRAGIKGHDGELVVSCGTFVSSIDGQSLEVQKACYSIAKVDWMPPEQLREILIKIPSDDD